MMTMKRRALTHRIYRARARPHRSRRAPRAREYAQTTHSHRSRVAFVASVVASARGVAAPVRARVNRPTALRTARRHGERQRGVAECDDERDDGCDDGCDALVRPVFDVRGRAHGEDSHARPTRRASGQGFENGASCRGAEGRSAVRLRANAHEWVWCRRVGRAARARGGREGRETGEPLDGQRVASAVGFFGLLSLSLTTRRRTRTAAMGSMRVLRLVCFDGTDLVRVSCSLTCVDARGGVEGVGGVGVGRTGVRAAFTLPRTRSRGRDVHGKRARRRW